MLHSQHLFVYGTLSRGSTAPAATWLRARSRWLGRGSFPGYLFDLGAYPGAVFQPEAGARVWGDCLWLEEPTAVWPELDAYEGLDLGPAESEYQRRVVPIITLAGTLWPAQTYLYCLSTAHLPLIPGGDYLSWLGGGAQDPPT